MRDENTAEVSDPGYIVNAAGRRPAPRRICTWGRDALVADKR